MTHAQTHAHRTRPMTAALSAIGLIAPLAGAAPDVLIEDDFDDGVLDPAWELELACAKGYTGEESGTEFTVTDIDSICIDEGEGADWSRVSLRRAIPPTADFRMQADFSWDSENDRKAMQQLRFRLRNGCGAGVADVFYHDAWLHWSGARYAYIRPNRQFNPGFNDLPYAGSASVEIVRKGCDVTIHWNDHLILTGRTASPVESVTIEFVYYAYAANGESSFFGTETIDRIWLEGQPATVTSTDIDCSGGVDLDDLLAVLAAWGPCPEPPESCRADINGDGMVGFNDLLNVLDDWGDGVLCN